MKITRSQLKRIIREGVLDDIFGKKVTSLDDVTTVGDFKKLIKYAQSSKRAELGKEAAKEWAKSSLMDELLGKIPGAATAKNAADALKAMYDLPDEARTGTALDNLDIDDEVAKIVDDPIENAFLDALMKEIEGMSDDAPMDNLNVTRGLANYLEKEFDARTVSGFEESKSKRGTMKITRKQLRRIIRESIPRYVGPAVSDDMMVRINRIRRSDLQDHLYDIVDAIESGSPDYTLDMLKKNIEDAERLDEGADLRRKIRSMINERIDVINRETGEVIVFGREGREAAPEAAWPDLVKRLGLEPSDDGLDAAGDQSFTLSNQEFAKLEDEVLGKQDRRSAKRKSAQMAADRERLNIDNLLQRLRYWAEDTARDYMGDNPSVDLQDVAYDLADAWEFEFEPDEREELMWHFDGSLNDLKIYAAESMG